MHPLTEVDLGHGGDVNTAGNVGGVERDYQHHVRWEEDRPGAFGLTRLKSPPR